MISRPRLVAGSAVTLGALALFASPVGAESVCPATLLPGEVCTAVDTVVGTLVPTSPAPTTPTTQPTTDTTSPPTTAAPAQEPAPSPAPALPLPEIPLLPELTSPVPSPSSPPSDGGSAPAPSTSPGAGEASPASRSATPNMPAAGAATPAAGSSSGRPAVSPIVNGDETARGFDLPAPAAASPFVLGPAEVPTATNSGGPSQLAAAAGLPSGLDGEGGSSLPRPSTPITLAVLLVAGVLGAHGVRWIDRQTATQASQS